MVFDKTDPYKYVAVMDYLFVGTVEKIVKNLMLGDLSDSDANLSIYSKLKQKDRAWSEAFPFRFP